MTFTAAIIFLSLFLYSQTLPLISFLPNHPLIWTKQTGNYFPTPSHNLAAQIKKTLIQSAHTAIPQNTTFSLKHAVPWWNQELTLLKNTKNNKFKLLKRNINTVNILEFKKANAKFRRAIKEASLYNFTSDINPNSDPSRMWANIKRLCGLHPTKHIHAIYNPLTQDTYTCPSQIANTFGDLWTQTSLIPL